MTCKNETSIPNLGDAPINTMGRITIDDATPCVDAQIEPDAGNWIRYQVTGLTRTDAIIMGLLVLCVLASFAGCVMLAIRSDTTSGKHCR